MWFIAPLPEGTKVLVQGNTETGAILAANDNYFYTIDQNTGYEISVYTGIQNLQKGWHVFVATYSDLKTMTAYVDGVANRKERKVEIKENLKYFGNNKKAKILLGLCAT